MPVQLAKQVRRVEPSDPVGGGHDYADAFEVDLPGPDPHPPEDWLRAGLAATGGVVKRIVGVLVGRRVEPSRRVMTTFLYFRRPVLARLVWFFVGLGHRRTALKVITAKTD
ncbi:hypothetical protein [Actinokineospora sp.]|uniref:hypothetical protein n=1 Tax=Actinokineospora sp. TaxID=1872133 RepID=UPI003D6A0DBA